MPKLRTYKYVITFVKDGKRQLLLTSRGDPVTYDNPERGQDYIRAIETYPKTSHSLKSLRVERAHKWRAEIAAAIIRGQ